MCVCVCGCGEGGGGRCLQARPHTLVCMFVSVWVCMSGGVTPGVLTYLCVCVGVCECVTLCLCA